ncbi:MAG TPA: ATP phosphoribosyltransferase [Acidobacteriota bacterium]|jgi:ATP phosphoribosyltransferase|nr:ATP phosphoribosyltransferase [Acidobacteriota bacterium]
MIVMALPKGRILDASLAFLQGCGISLPSHIGVTRKLQLESENGCYRFILVKPIDVPTYVEYGASDAGICGTDVLRESAPDVHQPLDLQFGRCRMVLAGTREQQMRPSPRIATKYPRITEQFFRQRGKAVEVIPLSGSVELAPALGLADLIVDLVETGNTLRENGLVVVEEIMQCTARLIINRASFHTRQKEISALLDAMERRLS